MLPAFPAEGPFAILETRGKRALAENLKVPRTAGPSGYLPDGVPGNSRAIDGDHPYTGNGFTASKDGYLAPERHTPSTPMDAGVEVVGQTTVPITVMRLRHGNGLPYQIPVDSPILPPNFPRHHAVDGVLPSDWKLMPDSNSPTGF